MTPPISPRRALRYGVLLGLLVVPVGASTTSTVERRALAAEETYVADRLGSAPSLDRWGTREGAGPRADASTIGPTAAGVRVAVTLPYAYTATAEGETIHADTASEALYAVAPGGVHRVAGDEISPC